MELTSTIFNADLHLTEIQINWFTFHQPSNKGNTKLRQISLKLSYFLQHQQEGIFFWLKPPSRKPWWLKVFVLSIIKRKVTSSQLSTRRLFGKSHSVESREKPMEVTEMVEGIYLFEILFQINRYTICGSTHHAIQNTATFLEYTQTTFRCYCLQNPSKDCSPPCEANLRQTKSARSLHRYFRARKNCHLFHVWMTCYQSTATKKKLKAQNQVKKIGKWKSKFIKK